MNTKATGGVLLLVEDDDSIGRLVKAYLEQQDGWRVVWLRSGEEAVAELRRHPVRLVVLDIGLPGIDGFEVCRQMRAQSKVPIIMLTARDEEPDRVAGLELGADDYVAKPFSPRELAARIKAILRRVEQRGEDAMLSARDIVLRRDSRDVTVAGAQIELTSKEFDLLACFLEHPGIVLSREKLLDIVWGMTYPGGTRTVDVHVAQLRRKLGDPETIRTVRGAGYKLAAVACCRARDRGGVRGNREVTPCTWSHRRGGALAGGPGARGGAGGGGPRGGG
jgi:DNA-binding response OmpR family regulator